MNSTAALPDTLASNRRARLLLAGCFLISVVMAFITKGTYDSGDSVKHYLFAHYAFQYPLNYFDSWAKPLFTLLASGPAQAGFIGMKLFQCTVVAVSAWCSYIIARALRLPMPELVVLFCYTAPDYFLIQFSGLTEPLFGLILVASVALAMTGRLGWSAALISFLPFVRSEGFILIGIWVVYLAWERQWRYLPLVVLGYALFSIAGAIVLGEIGWVFGHNPYETISVYGHGEWLHFVTRLPNLLGWVLSGLVAVGGICMLRDCFRPARRQEPLFSAELLLVYGSVAVFIAAHTIFWALGLFNSFGLTRVLTITTPLFALVALRGLAELAMLGRSPQARRRIQIGGAMAAVLFLFTGARNAFRWKRDFATPPDQVVVDRAAAWLRQTENMASRPMAYEFPYVSVATGNNPFSPQTHPGLGLNQQGQLVSLPVGALLIWDDWYTPTEARVQLATMRADARFRERWQTALPRHPEHPERDTTRVIIFERVR
jgi:hypothetical protein